MDIEARQVSMEYRDADRSVEVFSGLDLKIDSGTTVAIVGQSGVGKTTLLNLLGMLEMPTGGTISLGDTVVTDSTLSSDERAKFRGANIGFVFQFHQLLAEFDAVENVAMPLLIQGVDPRDSRERAKSLLGRVGLSHRLQHRPFELSGGEQQRVAMARALVTQPGIVLADEPTGNLDHHTGSEVHDLLLSMQQEHKMTLAIVTHSLEIARSLERVLELTPKGLVER